MSKNKGNKKGMTPFDIADNEGGKNTKKNPYDKEPLLAQRNSIFY